MSRILHFEHYTFAIAYILAAAFPFVRIMLGSIPIYLMDIFILLSFAICVTKSHRMILSPVHKVALLIIVLLVLSILYLYADTGVIGVFLYRNGRRVISMLPIFVVSCLAKRNRINMAYLEKLVIAGLLCHSVFVFGQYFLSMFIPEVYRVIDGFYYNYLSSMPNQSRIYLWNINWYTARAFGGYWNPNSAVAALTLVVPFVLTIKSHMYMSLTWFLVIVSVLLTGSRQGVVIMSLFILYYTVIHFVSKGRKYIIGYRIFILLFFASILLGRVLAPNTWDRIGPDSGIDKYNISISSRLDNYNDFFNYMFIERPDYLIFGQGVDFHNVSVQAGIESYFGRGFVSNSWLLIIAQQGIFSFFLFAWLFTWLLKHSMHFTYLQMSLLAYAFLAAMDNHMAIYESLQVIFWTIAGIVIARYNILVSYNRESQNVMLP